MTNLIALLALAVTALALVLAILVQLQQFY